MDNNYRMDFPLLLTRKEKDKRLVYLDSAATSQKPLSVIKAIEGYYNNYTANPHRGAYTLSEDATGLYEKAREKVAHFIGCNNPQEIVFTAGTTESINMAALSFGRANIKEGDEILLTVAEHHSNLLPWQRLAKEKNAVLRYVYGDEQGQIPLREWEEKINSRTKIVALGHISNVLGGINPVEEIARMAHRHGAVVVLDGAQSVPHIKIDVKELDVDFFAFSGHKMLAPAGIGVLYARKELLDAMEPLMLGGGIVEDVQEQSVDFMDAPWKMEAGTPNVEGVVGLSAAIDYLDQVGWTNIHNIEKQLLQYALERLNGLNEVEIYGSRHPENRAGILSFNVKDVHPHDVASILNSYGVAIRAGHHCAQPLMKHLGVYSTCRASFYLYNTLEDVDIFIDALSKVREVLGYGT